MTGFEIARVEDCSTVVKSDANSFKMLGACDEKV